MTRLNADYDWDSFDPSAYLQLNYGRPRGDDRWLTRELGAFYASLPDGLQALDVGTGPNLITLLAASGRAIEVTSWEHSLANIAWLRSTIDDSPELPAIWRVFWDDLVEAAPDVYEISSPLGLLRSRVRLVKGSIFDLPERQWDVATMFFVAESLTSDLGEFRQACSCLARAVKPGGSLAAAFMERSTGYFAGSQAFPAVPISLAEIAAAFEEQVDTITIHRVPSRGPRVRQGYEGMLFMTATVRQDNLGDQP